MQGKCIVEIFAQGQNASGKECLVCSDRMDRKPYVNRHFSIKHFFHNTFFPTRLLFCASWNMAQL